VAKRYAEEVVFGVWDVIAIVDIAEVAVNDTLTFKVGWIVELLRVETVDVNYVSKTRPMMDENMCFKLILRNIAIADKITTLIIDVYDNLSSSLGQVIVENEQISPSVTVFFIEDLLIPKWASLGAGMVYTNAYTALPH